MSQEHQVKFLEKSLEIIHRLRTAYDNKANFLLGISGVLFVLSVGQYQQTQFLILAVFSLLAAIFCICSIVLPYRRISQQGSKNIFCWWGVRGKKYQDYLKDIKEKIKDDNDLIREYSAEIYALYHDSIRYKVFLLRIAAFSLLVGFIIELFYLVFKF